MLRFPMDARHPLTQQPYGAYAVGEVFPFPYQDQLYDGRVIERLVSRADGLVELHVQAREERRTRRKVRRSEQKEQLMSLLHVEGVTHWSIPVNNLEEAEAFYGDLLGLTPVGRLGTARMACFTAGAHHILLCERAATVDHTFVEDRRCITRSP